VNYEICALFCSEAGVGTRDSCTTRSSLIKTCTTWALTFIQRRVTLCDIRASSFDKRACSSCTKYARTLAIQRTRYLGHIRGEPWKFLSTSHILQISCARQDVKSGLSLFISPYGWFHSPAWTFVFVWWTILKSNASLVCKKWKMGIGCLNETSKQDIDPLSYQVSFQNWTGIPEGLRYTKERTTTCTVHVSII